MKNRILKTAVALLLCTMTAISCELDNFPEINLKNEDISLTLKGTSLLDYDSANWQTAFSSARNEYRIHDDSMGRYFIMRCTEKPSYEGQTLKADITYTTSSNVVRESGLTFEVQKIDGSGRIWLWNKSKKYGTVIRQP